jgi:hypothetical protein
MKKRERSSSIGENDQKAKTPRPDENVTTEDAWTTAREWYEKGKIVIPLSIDGKAQGKAPCITGWQHTTLEQSKAYLDTPTYRSRNWGILTGEKNGFWVLDLDLAKEGTLSGVDYVVNWMKTNNIESCPCAVQTGSGGMHFYFQWNPPLSFEKNFAGLTVDGKRYGIDVRSNGGQVVLPGSVHPTTGKKYAWVTENHFDPQPIPSTLFQHLEQLTKPKPSPMKLLPPSKKLSIGNMPPSSSNSSSPNSTSSPEFIGKVIRKLSEKRSDHRDDWIRVLLFLKQCGEEFKDLAREFSKKSKKYEEDSFEKGWNSLKPNGTLNLDCFSSWLKEDHKVEVSATLSSKKPFMLDSAMSINQFIRKYDQKNLDFLDLFDFEWDLMSFAARITKTSEYVFKNAQRDYSSVSFSEFEGKFKGCHVTLDNERKVSFLDLIQQFKTSILYSKTSFRPEIGHQMEQNGDQIYNLFFGFAYQTSNGGDLDEKDLGALEDDHTLLGFIYQILCNDEERVYEWFLDWLAHMLQFPCEIVGVAPVFIGEEGAGKQTFWDFVGNHIIGSPYFTTKGINDLLANFNDSIQNKVLLVVNEANIKETHMDALKQNITDSPIALRIKYKNTGDMNNFGNWVFLTNQKKPFEKLNAKQRRFGIYRYNDRYAGKSHNAYWSHMKSYLTPELAVTFANNLLKRPLEGKNVRDWPESEYYKKMNEEEQDHPIIEYLEGEEFLKEFPERKAQSSLLLRACNNWLSSINHAQLNGNGKQLNEICCNQLKWSHAKSSGVFVYTRPDVPSKENE